MPLYIREGWWKSNQILLAFVFRDDFFSKTEKYLISFKYVRIFQYFIWELAVITKTAILVIFTSPDILHPQD